MKTHVDELIEKWRLETRYTMQKADDLEYGCWVTLTQCLADLKDALLLDEAENVK